MPDDDGLHHRERGGHVHRSETRGGWQRDAGDDRPDEPRPLREDDHRHVHERSRRGGSCPRAWRILERPRPAGRVTGVVFQWIHRYRPEAVWRHQRRRQHGLRRVQLRHSGPCRGGEITRQPVPQLHGVERLGRQPCTHRLTDSPEQHHAESGWEPVLYLPDSRPLHRSRQPLRDAPCHDLFRDGRRDYAHRADAADRSGDQAVPDGNQGAPERVAPQRVQRLDGRKPRPDRTDPGDAAECAGAPAVVRT